MKTEYLHMKGILLKADLHVHSKYSRRPSAWVLRKIGCSESYTEPENLYALARDRGMDLVTITDHNTLAGSLEIAHLENTFLSEEITTYFPEDRCKFHVLAYDITEKQHEDISVLRNNVFQLIKYLNQEKIIYALAHPLFAINDRLTIEHLEQAFLLFNNFEINGSRDDHQNSVLQEILKNLTRADIDYLSNKYDLEPVGHEPWSKTLIGGSDDHSSLYIATTYTEVEGVSSVKEFMAGIAQNTVKVNAVASSPQTLSHNLCSIAYQFYCNKFGLDRYVDKEPLIKFIDHALVPSSEKGAGLGKRIRNIVTSRMSGHLFKSMPGTIGDIFQKNAAAIILKSPCMSKLLKQSNHNLEDMNKAWFQFANQISEEILRQFADSILKSLNSANLFNVFHTIGSVGSIYTMLAPYFVSYSVFVKDRRFCSYCLEHFSNGGKPTSLSQQDTSRQIKRPRLKIAHFTDTFYDINGVALTLRMQVEMAIKNKKQLTIITCCPESGISGPSATARHERSGVTNFMPVGTFEMPEYPDMKLYYPSLLEMLNYCYEQQFSHIHSATPGPIGLAALAIASILKIPIYGTYHTALPQYVNHLTDDQYMEDIMWKYLIWYYNQMDALYVPSMATGNELEEKGIPKEKIRFYPRGIDIQRFHPSRGNGFFSKRFDLSENGFKLLYVGRISKEKNLSDLVDTCKGLAEIRSDFHLIMVGSGPYLNEMKIELNGLPAIFTGFLEGDELAQAYASADIFIFPSTTDTFGNVVLEAQASGLPVIVSDEGGPKENLIPGKTGFIVPARNPGALSEAVFKLMNNPQRLKEMKQNARSYTEDRSFESANAKLWESYRTVSC